MKKNLIPFTPIGKSFLVEVVLKDKTESGLIMPSGVAPELGDKDFKGYLVLATGPMCTEVQPGDTVMIKDGVMQRQVGMIINVDNLAVTLVSFNEYDVFAIREDVPKVEDYKWHSTKPAYSLPVETGTLAVFDNDGKQ